MGMNYSARMERKLRQLLADGCFKRVPASRSRVMRAIKGADNQTTERRLRLALVRSGMTGWKVRAPGIPGTPDFVFPYSRLAIFADGCFWHGCPTCNRSKVRTNASFWAAKMQFNREKDCRVARSLRRSGWRVMRIWEHDLRDTLPQVVERIRRRLNRRPCS